jgi:hypothetical protein
MQDDVLDKCKQNVEREYRRLCAAAAARAVAQPGLPAHVTTADAWDWVEEQAGNLFSAPDINAVLQKSEGAEDDDNLSLSQFSHIVVRMFEQFFRLLDHSEAGYLSVVRPRPHARMACMHLCIQIPVCGAPRPRAVSRCFTCAGVPALLCVRRPHLRRHACAGAPAPSALRRSTSERPWVTAAPTTRAGFAQEDLRDAFGDSTTGDVTGALKAAMSQLDLDGDGGISLNELLRVGLGSALPP